MRQYNKKKEQQKAQEIYYFDFITPFNFTGQRKGEAEEDYKKSEGEEKVSTAKRHRE